MIAGARMGSGTTHMEAQVLAIPLGLDQPARVAIIPATATMAATLKAGALAHPVCFSLLWLET